jgi:hypothetical protein
VNSREFLFETTGHVAYDDAVELLIRLGGYKGQPTGKTLGLLQQEISEQVNASVSGPRDEAMCRKLAAKISGLGVCMDKFAPNPTMKSSWLAELAKIMDGKETFLPSGARPGSSPITDPCVAAIKQSAATQI